MAASLKKLDLHRAPERMEHIIYGALLFLTLILFFNKCFNPLQTQISNDSDHIEVTTTEIAKLEEARRQIEEAEKAEAAKKTSTPDSSEQVVKVDKRAVVVASKEEIETYQKMLSTVIEKSPISVSDVKFGSQNKEGQYVQYGVDLAFKGTYLGIGFFLDELAKTKPVLVIDNIKMDHKTEEVSELIEVTMKGFYYGKRI